MPRRQLRWPGPTKGRPARGPPSTCAARPRRRTTAISTHQLPKIGFWYFHVPKQEQPKIEDLCPFGKIKNESFQKMCIKKSPTTLHSDWPKRRKSPAVGGWSKIDPRTKIPHPTFGVFVAVCCGAVVTWRHLRHLLVENLARPNTP